MRHIKSPSMRLFDLRWPKADSFLRPLFTTFAPTENCGICLFPKVFAKPGDLSCASERWRVAGSLAVA
jgi:hypothetical protein